MFDVTQAECRKYDPELWFPLDEDRPSPQALAVCQVCPVRLGCLQFALETGPAGVWGGTTEAQRRQLRLSVAV